MKSNLKVGRNQNKFVQSVEKKKFYNYETDGITQGLLGTWMSCRQKSKWFLEGYSAGKISGSLIYGTIIHGVLEIVYDSIMKKKLTSIPDSKQIKTLIKRIEESWLKENPGANKYALEDLEMGLLIAESTLPAYFKYWWKKDLKELKWKQLEQQFAIPYTTKDGRTTIIRGKKDGVFGDKTIKLFETKTKSQINADDLIETLWFELQVSLYLWAIKKTYKSVPAGVTYNIIRKTGLKIKQNESKVLFGKRISEEINKNPDYHFLRLNISVTKQDMDFFEQELESMIVDFMNWCDGKTGTYRNTSQCINKYGTCEYLGLCSKKDFGAFKKRKIVFRELEDL